MKRKKRTNNRRANKGKKNAEHVRDSSKLNDAELNCKGKDIKGGVTLK